MSSTPDDDRPEVTEEQESPPMGPVTPNEPPAPSLGPNSATHEERTEHVGDVLIMDDEEVLYDLNPSWRKYSRSIAAWVGLSLVSFGIGLLVAWYPLLKIRRRIRQTRYIITSERAVVQEAGGLFGTSETSEYPIRDLTDIEATATARQRRAGCGTVTFVEHDGEGSTVELGWIPDHQDVASTLGAYQRRLAPRGRYSPRSNSR